MLPKISLLGIEDRDDEDLEMTIRMSMQQAASEPECSKPKDAATWSFRGLVDSPESKTWLLELVAAAVEKRMALLVFRLRLLVVVVPFNEGDSSSDSGSRDIESGSDLILVCDCVGFCKTTGWIHVCLNGKPTVAKNKADKRLKMVGKVTR